MVEVGGGPKTLDQRDGAALALFAFESNAIQQMAPDHALEHLQHRRDQLGLCSQQQAQGDGH